MKKLITGILTILTVSLTAQNVPQGINYQAVARDNSGSEIISTGITVRYSIGTSTVTNATFNYQETHTISTNQFGLFNTVIGQGTASGTSGTFNNIGWSTPQYLLVEIDFGSGYEQMGVATPFVTVPYSFLAKDVINKELPSTATNNDVLSWNGTNWVAVAPSSTSETNTTIADNLDGTFTYVNELGASVTFDANIDDADASITNEIQDLNLSGNTLTITNNGTATPIDLSIYNELPTATATGQTLIWNGTAWTAVSPADPSATNEIQNVTVVGNAINISGGTGTTIASNTPATTGQVLTWSGTAWEAQNAGSGADNWGSQTVASDGTLSGLGTTGNPLSGFDGDYTNLTNQPTIPSNTSDLTNDSGFLTTEVDGSTTNEIQTLSIASNTLTISGTGGNSVTLPSTTDTDDQTIDVFQLNANSLELSLEDDGAATQTVDLSSIADKTVAITGTGATTVSGTYPNFTVNSTDNNTTYTAGTGINITGANVIVNSAPDQTVSLTGATGITVAGTYPNFTLTGSVDTDWTQGSGITYNTADYIGIGTNSPSTKLHINETMNVAGAQQTITNLGTASNASTGLAFTNSVSAQGYMIGIDNTNGTFKISNSSANINSFNRFQIFSSGEVGIGNFVTPYSTLDVNGQITMRTGATAGYIPVSDANGTMTWTSPSSIVDTDWTEGTGIVYNTTANIGIGTSTPSNKLHVLNGNLGIFRDDSQDPLIHFNGDVTNISWTVGMEDSDQGYFKIAAESALSTKTKLTITDDGFVGIGETEPTELLYIKGGDADMDLETVSSTESSSFHIKRAGGVLGSETVMPSGHFYGNIQFQGYDGSQYLNGVRIEASTDGIPSSGNMPSKLVFYTNSGTTSETEKMRIDKDGLVGIGTSLATHKLHVANSTTRKTGYFQNNLSAGNIALNEIMGVHGETNGSGSSDKIGGYFESTNGTGTNYGVYGYASGGTTNWAGYFESGNVYMQNNVAIGHTVPTKKLHVVHAPSASYDAAIYGSNTTAINSGFYGALAYDGGPHNYGVYAHSDALSNTSPLGVNRASDGSLVRFMSGGILEGAITVSGGTVSYGAFTGVHYAISDEVAFSKGLLVSLNGENGYLNGNQDSEILHGINISTIPNDPKIMGTYLAKLEETSEHTSENPHQVMSVGNGIMWVIDNGKNIESGDYFISSSTPGHAMLDQGNYEIANIIARASEPVNWEKETTMINGIKHKKVAVFFESFIINHKAVKLETELDLLKSKFNILENEIELINQKIGIGSTSKNDLK